MFKRANKITSLLVAAAAVVSLVPASASDYTKVDSEDGIIYSAIAYADGKAYVDGEIDDEEAAYYVEDGDFTELDDVDSGDDVETFGEGYLDVEDGDYTVDLSTGEVTDDDIAGDTADDAASALRKAIKDDTEDRYDETEADDIKDEEDLTVISGSKFGAVWYETDYTAASDSTTNGDATSFKVYTDTDGNYIDADYSLGKIKVTTTATASTYETVTIDNTDDTYDADDQEDAVSASVSHEKTLTQDDDYIYRLVTVTVSVDSDLTDAKISEIDGNDVADGIESEVFTSTNDGQTISFKAIQKISKEQDSDDIDGAYYANTVNTYIVSDSDSDALDNEDLITDDDTEFTIAGGKLIAYSTADDAETVVVNAYTLKSSNGYYYADEEDESSEDCEYNDDEEASAVQVDVDGNLWRLDGGYIYKFDNTDDWDKVYKVDGSLDELSVYDEDNMIAWSEDDEVYSIIAGTSTTDETDATDEETDTTDTTDATDATTTPVITAGWAKAVDGTWSFVNTDGTNATGWLQDGATWYYLKADGVMATGWQNVGGTWYYLAGSGAMLTGWYTDTTGTWYYSNGSGAMLANTVVDGYKLGASGAWVK
jgi:hypothetical protein